MGTNLQSPFVNWAVKQQFSKAGFDEHRVLIIGQGNGSSDPKLLIEDVQQSEVAALCGDSSVLTLAYNRFRDFNKATEVDLIPLAEPTEGQKAAGGITATGTASESGNLVLHIIDDMYRLEVAILSGDDQNAIVTKIANAINADAALSKLLLASTTDNTCNIEYKIKGEIGNGLTSTADNRINGVTITHQVFSGGAGAYDSADILDALTKRYHTVIFDNATNFDMIETWLQARINVPNAVMGGSGVTVVNDSRADLKTFAAAKNSQSMVVIGNLDEMKYNLVPLFAACEFGAKRALRLTSGAIVADLVLDAQEAYGGVDKSSLPYHNTPISYAKPVGVITLEQLQDLNDEGLSFFVPATQGVVLGSIKTLYKTDLSGIDDVTFRFLNAFDTALAIQEYFFVNTKKKFGQTRATKGDLLPGKSMSNELSVKAYIVGLYDDVANMALAQDGKDALKAFKRDLTVTLDVATGFYSVYAPVAIVSQFRGLNGTVAIGYEFK